MGSAAGKGLGWGVALGIVALAGCGLVVDMDPPGREPDDGAVDAGLRRDSAAVDDAGSRRDGRVGPMDATSADARRLDTARVPRDTGTIAMDGGLADAIRPPLDGFPVADAVLAGPCTANSACRLTEYCHGGDGACLSPGTCRALPIWTDCPAVYAPVCGCDGHSYPNRCAAALRGVRVATTGPCAATCAMRPAIAGGCCLDDVDCRPLEQCVGSTCPGLGWCRSRLAYGGCWENRDCGLGMMCIGADSCRPGVCGAGSCTPATPGTCM